MEGAVLAESSAPASLCRAFSNHLENKDRTPDLVSHTSHNRGDEESERVENQPPAGTWPEALKRLYSIS